MIGYPYAKNMNLNPYFILSVKFRSKYVTDLNIKPRTMKFLEESCG